MKKIYLSLFICLATYSLSNAQCSANFIASKNPICDGDAVYFTNITTGKILSYVWDFGAGANPPNYNGENPPNVTYTGAGTKTISLTVQCVDSVSGPGSTCTTIGILCPLFCFTTCVINPGTAPGTATISTSIRKSSITVLAIPAPAFTSTPASGNICANTPVNFTYTGTAGATSYAWVFGAGASPSTSNDQNPQGIVYSTPGSKTVSLTVSNGACERSISQPVTINPAPTASFVSTAPACTGQNVDFTNTGTTGATYSWDFGSNATPATSAIENPTGITYSTPGGKTVTLTVTQGSCSTTIAQGINIYQSPTATFTASPNPACTNANVSFSSAGSSTGGSWRYSWDFGSGAIPATSTAENPTGIVYSTAGIKTIALTVFDNHCSTTFTTTITINLSPTSSFSSTAPACTGQPVDFTNTGTGTAWNWDFGSGATPATSTNQNPSGVTYSTPGGKIVTLVSSIGTCSVTATQPITIYQSPIVTITAPAPPLCTNTGVNFSSAGSSTGGSWIYSWDLGSGATPATSSAQNPTGILYSTAGTKTITLTVFDNHCSTTFTTTITINQTPTASFSSNAPACTGISVNFTNTGSTGSGLNWKWNFGSNAAPATLGFGATPAIENPTGVTYSTAGGKIVQLITKTATCADTVTQAITIYESPTAVFTLPASACTKTGVDFTSTDGTTSSDGFNWVYSWDFGTDAIPQGSSAQNPKGVFYTSSGSKNITLTVADEHCSATTSQTYTINPTPTASFTSSAPACKGETVNFTNTGTGASWVWTLGTNGTVVAPNTLTSQNTSATYSSAGQKTVTLTGTIGTCSDVATEIITIYESPTAIFTLPASACTKTGVDFTSSDGTTSSDGFNWTYTWDFGADAIPQGSSAQNPKGVFYTSSGSKTITLTVSDEHCSATTTQAYIIKATPIASFTSSAPACKGETVNFTNTGTGTTWVWTLGSGGAVVAPSTLTSQNTSATYSSAGQKTVTLTSTIGSCSDVATEIITIYESPTAIFTLPASACTKTGVDFTSTDGSTSSDGFNWVYSWDFGADAIPQGSTAQNPKGVFYTSSGSKTITLNVADEHCSATTTQAYIIKATPTAGFSSTAPQCTGLPVDFINTGSTGAAGLSWAWTFDLVSGTSATPATIGTESPTGVIYSTAGEKIVQQIVTLGTCSDTSTKAITIHQTPTATFTSNAPKCAGSPVTFTNTGSTGGFSPPSGSSWTYFWDFGQGASPQTSTSENPAGVAYSTGGTKTITFTIFNQYCTNTATQTIIINALPVANAGRDTTICANTTVQIGSANIAGNTYSWFAPVTLSSATISNPIATPVAHITEYIVTVKNANGCINKDTVVVTMLDPIKANAGIDVEICRYDSVQIGAGLVEQQIYKWTPAAGLSSTVTPNPMASPDSTTTYTVTVTYKGKACKAETDQVMVTVHQLPIIEAGTVHHQPSPTNDTIIKDTLGIGHHQPRNDKIIKDTITLGSSIQLIAIGGLQYSWSPAYHLNNAGIFNPIASPDTTITYVITGTDIYGCINKDTVTIVVIVPSFWVPNTFTPNGNGENDVFYVRGSGITNFELGIFNRWGEQIYLSKKMDEGWDGKRAIGGEELPAGAYVYYIKGKLTDGTPVDSKGLINLIR